MSSDVVITSVGKARLGSRALALWAAALGLVVLGAVASAQLSGWRMAVLWLVGAGLGMALYLSSFGFTFGFRALMREGRSAQVRGQLLLLALLVVAFFPLIAVGSAFGQPVRGFVMPVGLELVIGAFLFGVGMQLGGGCASGTLYAAGGGSTRMLVTLGAFIAGATLAAASYPVWADLPAFPAFSILQTVGTIPAIALHLALFGALWLFVAAIERRRHGRVASILRPEGANVWSYALGAAVLAALCLATLLLAGRPWAITQAFALWGSWGVEATGLDDPVFWPFWEESTRVEALHRRLFADTMSVMDLGLVAGALLAAVAAGRFAPVWRIPARALAASVIGGLLLGYGAILATGCNISAFVSGVASGSLHGWVWIAAALPGNALGIALRPLFRLDGTPARPG